MNAPATPAAGILTRQLDPKLIAFSLTNRKRFNADAMKDFVANVKAHGVITPVLVRPLPAHRKDTPLAQFELVYGERRIRAAIEAGLPDVPANVRDLTDTQALEFQIVENVQREDIHPLEEAEAYERLMRCENPATQKQYTADDIAGKVGKARRTVYLRIQLLKLCPEARAAFYDGQIDISRAELIARIGHHNFQREALKEITAVPQWEDHPMSFREARDHIAHHYMLELSKAPFDIKAVDYADAGKKIIAGACGPCPKRTGNNKELFGDIKGADICTDPACHGAKREAHNRRLLDAAEKKGVKVIKGADAKKLLPQIHSDLKDYTSAGESAYLNGKHQEYRKVLGKDMPPVSLFENPHTHEVQEVVSDKDLEKALKAKGIKVGFQSGGRRITTPAARAKQKSDKARADAEMEVRRRTHFAVREAIAKQGLAAEDIRLIAQTTYEKLWNEFRKTIAGWWAEIPAVATQPSKPEKKAHVDRVQLLIKRIPAMTGTEAMQLLMDCALVPAVTGQSFGGKAQKSDLAAAAARYKVDVRAIESQVKAETAAKIKPAKKLIPGNTLARKQLAANARSMIAPVIRPLIKSM